MQPNEETETHPLFIIIKGEQDSQSLSFCALFDQAGAERVAEQGPQLRRCPEEYWTSTRRREGGGAHGRSSGAVTNPVAGDPRSVGRSVPRLASLPRFRSSETPPNRPNLLAASATAGTVSKALRHYNSHYSVQTPARPRRRPPQSGWSLKGLHWAELPYFYQ